MSDFTKTRLIDFGYRAVILALVALWVVVQ